MVAINHVDVVLVKTHIVQDVVAVIITMIAQIVRDVDATMDVAINKETDAVHVHQDHAHQDHVHAQAVKIVVVHNIASA